VASPVTGRPSRGRLYAGTATREAPESFEPDDADEALPPLRVEELPPRGIADPVLLPPLRERAG
jgi:hypothetical protein